MSCAALSSPGSRGRCPYARRRSPGFGIHRRRSQGLISPLGNWGQRENRKCRVFWSLSHEVSPEHSALHPWATCLPLPSLALSISCRVLGRKTGERRAQGLQGHRDQRPPPWGPRLRSFPQHTPEPTQIPAHAPQRVRKTEASNKTPSAPK